MEQRNRSKWESSDIFTIYSDSQSQNNTNTLSSSHASYNKAKKKFNMHHDKMQDTLDKEINQRIASLQSIGDTSGLNSGTNKEMSAKHQALLKREISFGQFSGKNNVGKSHQESDTMLGSAIGSGLASDRAL